MIASRSPCLLAISTLTLMICCFDPHSAIADRAATIKNIPPTPHFAPTGTPPADIAAAIEMAAALLDWAVVGNTPGDVTLLLRIRRHEAKVVVGYDASNYWINYLDSFNLDYSPNDLRRPGPSRRVIEGPRIHNNYNKWVEELSRSIANHTKNPPKPTKADSVPSSELPRIADELEKLDSLRQRGILTQEEFDEQKRKLLAL